MPSSARPATASYHHGNLRNACVSAALSLLATRGLHGVTLREVARRIGVSRSAPYRHFADKRDLLAACAVRGFEALIAEAADVRDTHNAPDLVQVRALLHRYAAFGAADPNLFRLMFASDFKETEYDDLAAAWRRAFGMLEDLVRHGQLKGHIAVGNTYARALTLWAAVHGLVTLCNDLAPSAVLDTRMLGAHVERVFDTLAPAFAPN